MFAGRCKATNKCLYCARQFAIETSEMLWLDALIDPPQVYLVLTAREHLTRKQTHSHLAHLRRSLRKRWPLVRWAVLVEFQRRGALHLNLLVKGVPREQADELRAAAAALWCTRVDAKEVAQWAGAIADAEAVVLYVTLHFMKPEQAPAIGWRGHRYSASRDYLSAPTPEMRERARASLREKRREWKAQREAWRRAIETSQAAGNDPDGRHHALFLGMLDDEGFIEQWTSEKRQELHELGVGNEGPYRLMQLDASGLRWREAKGRRMRDRRSPGGLRLPDPVRIALRPPPEDVAA